MATGPFAAVVAHDLQSAIVHRVSIIPPSFLS